MLKKIAIGVVTLIVVTVVGAFTADKLGLLDN